MDDKQNSNLPENSNELDTQQQINNSLGGKQPPKSSSSKRRRLLMLGVLIFICAGTIVFWAIRQTQYQKILLEGAPGSPPKYISQSDLNQYLEQQMDTPTQKELLSFEESKVKGQWPKAKTQLAAKLASYSQPYDGRIENSNVNLCYYTSIYEGFNTVGYSKACYVRATELFPLKEASYGEAIAKFETTYQPDQEGSTVNSSNQGPCTEYTMGQSELPFLAEFYFCPAGTSFEAIETYFHAFPEETIGSNMAHQIRGWSDDADIDGYLKVNYTLIEKDLYDMSAAINSANQKSKSGFVVIGVTNNYYDKRMK